MNDLDNRFNLLNDKWEFVFTFRYIEIDDVKLCEWNKVSLPHDWLIYDTHASEHGFEIAQMLVKYVHEFDPLVQIKHNSLNLHIQMIILHKLLI